MMNQERREMITKELRQLYHEMTTKYDQGFSKDLVSNLIFPRS